MRHSSCPLGMSLGCHWQLVVTHTLDHNSPLQANQLSTLLPQTSRSLTAVWPVLLDNMTKALNSDVGFQGKHFPIVRSLLLPSCSLRETPRTFLIAPTHRHIPRSMAYAPPFYVEFINTHFDPFESTANVYFTGQSNPRLFAPYVLHPSIRTNTIDIGVQHYHCHQHEMPLQFQTLVDAHYQTHTPLSTYRLPPPLTAPLAVSEISKNHKDGCSSIFSRADAPQSYTAIFPDTRSMLVSQPTIGDGSCITKQLAPTAHEHVSIEVKPGSSNRGYMPPTPSSVPSEVISPSTQSFQQDSFGQSLPSGGTSKRSKENSRTRHYCELCEQSFTRAHDLKRHNTIHEQCKRTHSQSGSDCILTEIYL